MELRRERFLSFELEVTAPWGWVGLGWKILSWLTKKMHQIIKYCMLMMEALHTAVHHCVSTP